MFTLNYKNYLWRQRQKLFQQLQFKGKSWLRANWYCTGTMGQFSHGQKPVILILEFSSNMNFSQILCGSYHMVVENSKTYSRRSTLWVLKRFSWIKNLSNHRQPDKKPAVDHKDYLYTLKFSYSHSLPWVLNLNRIRSLDHNLYNICFIYIFISFLLQ